MYINMDDFSKIADLKSYNCTSVKKKSNHKHFPYELCA